MNAATANTVADATAAPVTAQQTVNPRLERAVELCAAGRTDDAVTELINAIGEIGEAPSVDKYQERVMLTLNLVNIYATAGRGSEATERLAHEKSVANKLYQSLHATASPLEKRDLVRAYTELRELYTQFTLIGNPAPEISIKHWLGSAPLTLEALRGNVVVLEFWATWCNPCQATFPKVNKLYNENKDRGLQVIGLTRHYLAHDGTAEAKQAEVDFIHSVVEKHKLDFPIGIADGVETQMLYGASGVPTIVLIDRQGIVRCFGRFSASTNDPNFDQMLQDCLNETI